MKIDREQLERIEALMNLMRRRLDILSALYPSAILSEAELIEKAGLKDKGNLSRNITELKENGLVAVDKMKGKGNDRVMVSLSDLSVEILNSYVKWDKSAQPHKLLPDEEYIDSTLQLLKLNDQEIRRVAARELVDISEAYIIPSNSSFFVYLEKSLINEKDSDVLSNLLEAISTMITNSPDIRDLIKDRLDSQLSRIAMEDVEKSDRKSATLGIKILSSVYEGEKRYMLLLSVYEALIRKESQASRAAIDSLIGKNPEKRADIRQALLKRFKEASAGGRELIKGHLAVI